MLPNFKLIRLSYIFLLLIIVGLFATDKSLGTTYHTNGWIDEIRDPLQRPTKQFYQPNGNRDRVRNALLQDTTFVHDDLNRIEAITNTRNVDVVHTLDAAGNTRFLRNGRNHQAESVFDKLNRETDFYTPLRRHTHRVYSPRGLLTSVAEPSTQSAAITGKEAGTAHFKLPEWIFEL